MNQQPIQASRSNALPANGSGSAVRIDIGEGEEIVLVLGPHWLYIVLDRTMVLIVLLLANVGLWFLSDSWLVRTAGIVAVIGWLLWQLAERASRRYVLTTRRVVSVAGLLRQRVVDAPIRNVRQVTMFRSFPERVLGLGTLGFATAGTAGQDVVWRLIDRPGERFGEARRLIDAPAAGDQE